MKKNEHPVYELCIPALGLVTSVGHDYKTACASIRAGMKRPKKLMYFYVPNKKGYESSEDGLVTGNPIMEAPPEDRMGRILELLSKAFRDLKTDAALDEDEIGKIPVYLCLPGVDRWPFSADDVLDQIERIKSWPFSKKTSVKVYIRGHAGMLFALSDAAMAIQSGKIDRAVIAGADSLLGFDDLALFQKNDRLKTTLNPDGLIPGEAASAFMVEKTALVRRRGGSIKSMVRMISTAHSPRRIPESGMDSGLEQAIGDILVPSAPVPTVVNALISDVNGEPWRFKVWGLIQSRLFHKIAGERNLIFPAKNLGDTGAASSGIAVCMASRAMERGYLSATPQAGTSALILSSSDTGERAALLLGSYDENTNSKKRKITRN